MVEIKSPVLSSVWLRVVLLGVIVTAGGIYALIVGLPSQAEVRELVSDWERRACRGLCWAMPPSP